MAGLNVLITNNTLAPRAGTELYVRDLALELQRRGHTPVVYTTRAGEVARELRRSTVPVVEDLRRLGSAPDIIHGQHHAETMTALLHFASVPAVFFCHGWRPPEEEPPLFPRVLRYAAVDDVCRERLVCEHGVPEERVRVILNFVDLERFGARGPLPTRPRRALLFSNYASGATLIPAVREACARARLELDVLGSGVGRVCDEPEKVLGGYDLVFAKGRSALEALAVGASVVLCDAAGAGPLVTKAELERLRRLNFGLRVLRSEVSAEVLTREIERYDAGDATEVSREIRARAGRTEAVDEIVALYEEVIAEHRTTATDAAAEGRAAAEYLRQLVTGVRHEREALREQWAAFQASPTNRLRRQLLRAPLLGPLAQTLARRLSR
ncbi:MAG TPA: glycosyltransferase family 4 protein [Pyrinomonadaceae bacterium]|nr:glycosyltransferase family 4 protein [Pyrinomonadaceae bacterium]